MSETTQVNKAYFDNEAATYDQKHGKTLDRLVDEIRARLDFIGAEWADADSDSEDEGTTSAPPREVRLLDYACGTGVMSRALAPYTTQCVGIDVSENMVAAYNARARNQGLAESEMRAIQGNLVDAAAAAALSDPSLFGFDVAASCLAFHHLDDPGLAAKKLAERLRPGSGVLVILDFLPHDMQPGHSPHDGDAHAADAHAAAQHTVRHAGFTEENVRQMFEAAGVGGHFALQSVGDVVFSPHGHDSGRPAMKRRLFMARGTRL